MDRPKPAHTYAPQAHCLPPQLCVGQLNPARYATINLSLDQAKNEMDYNELKKAIKGIASKDLEQRKSWYSPAADAYNFARLKCLCTLVEEAIKVALLSSSSRILEIGSGPGTANLLCANRLSHGLH